LRASPPECVPTRATASRGACEQGVLLLQRLAATFDSFAGLLQDLRQARDRLLPDTRPFVTLAYAQSIDGSIALARGQRYALSGPDSLRLTHMLRNAHDAILVGVGTVLADDPELTVRMVEGRDPQPVVVDSQLRTPPTARLLSRNGRRPWIGTTIATATAIGNAHGNGSGNTGGAGRRARMEATGCRLMDCPAEPNGWVDLTALLRSLRAAGIRHVMVEGGARIITSFLAARLVDYAVVTIAPRFLGGLSAVGPLPRGRTENGAAQGAVDGGPRLARWTSAQVGEDLVLSGEIVWPTA
jgi:riboflavin biosynthesis pyrimidine reductase